MSGPSPQTALERSVQDGVAQAARALGPVRVAGGKELGLRLQDQAILKHLQMIGLERGAGGGDVDDQLGGAGGGRAFRGADALHDAVAGDAGLGEEAAGQIQIFGGDAQPPAMRSGELRGNVLEIGHAGDIDPAIRHGHHHVGAAEAERCARTPRLPRHREASRGSDPRRSRPYARGPTSS